MSSAPIVSIPAAAWYCKFLRTYGTLSGRPLRPYSFSRSTTSCTKNVVNVGERCLCEYTTSEDVLVEYYPQNLNQPGTGSNPARGQPNSKTYFSPVSVRVREFGLARRVQPWCFASARSFATLRPYMVLTHGISPAFRGGVHLNSHTANPQSVIPEFARPGTCVPMAFTAKRPCILSKTSNINRRAKYIVQLMFCVCCTRVGATGLELNLIN